MLFTLQCWACATAGGTHGALVSPHSTDALLGWEMQGKLGLRVTNGKGGFGYFTWKRSGNTWSLRISGPWGVGAARLVGDPWGVKLVAGKRTLHAASPEELLSEHFGWQLPVSNLFYWVLGKPRPEVSFEGERNPNGSFAELRQSGWRVIYQRYQLQQGFLLPDKMEMSRAGTRFTVRINRWQVEPGPLS